jgi:phage-related protein
MALQTFTWYPDIDSEQKAKPSVTVTKFGDGYESRVGNGINTQPMTWSMVFTRSRAEGLAILSFLRARGSEQAFYWTNPLEELGVYVCREWSTRQMKNGHIRVTCSFEQVFES